MRCFLVMLWVVLSLSNAKANDHLKEEALLASDSSAVTKWYQTKMVQECMVPVGLAMSSGIILAVPGLKAALQKPLSWNWNENTHSHYVNLSNKTSPPDYLLENEIRYVPAFAAYALDLCGLKSRHRFIDKSVILAASYIVSDFVVYNGKKLTKSLRPGRDINSVSDFSFPSQHTAMAFVAATFLDHELGYVSPWISIGGYATATYVAMVRVANNDHWTSDVLMAAAVGILATDAAYWAYDGIMKRFPKHLTLSPIFDSQQTGLALCYHF